MEISFEIDGTCETCKQGLEHRESLKKQNKKAYGTYERGKSKAIPAIVLRPDYNAYGNLTHWHIEREGFER